MNGFRDDVPGFQEVSESSEIDGIFYAYII